MTDTRWSVTMIDGVRHVIPVDDLLYHTADNCDCHPRVERVGFGVIVIHNAYDQRERNEKDKVEVRQ